MLTTSLNVLFITHYSRYYGANRSLLQLILELKSNYGIKSLVIVPSEGRFTVELTQHQIPFEVHHFHNWLNPKNQFFKSLLKNILNRYLFYRIERALKKNRTKIDLVHSNSSATNLGGYLSSCFKKPHVWHIREYGDKDYNLAFSFGIKNAAKFFNRKSDIIILISKSLYDHYSSCLRSEKLRVVYNGIPIPLRTEKKFKKDSFLNICCVGVISETKNQIELINACNYLVHYENISDFVLYIIGEGSKDYVEGMKRQVQENGLEKHIKFVGYMSNIDEFLQKMDIGIVPSKSEAFGRVTIEYMMNSIPVIASNSGANSELVKHNESGFLYPLGNYKELAKYICTFIKNKEEVERMGSFARKYSISEFSSVKNTNEIYKIYKEVLTEDAD